ncbi:unnamed protein product [Closterium sp. Naga37s-1]|nr:unnamed protein product [Closterium sp. Naga37s-1]
MIRRFRPRSREFAARIRARAQPRAHCADRGSGRAAPPRVPSVGEEEPRAEQGSGSGAVQSRGEGRGGGMSGSGGSLSGLGGGVSSGFVAGGRRWEDLRKDARRVESEVDHRLAAYSKLGAAFALASSSTAAGSLPDPSEAQIREGEIEALLQQLASLNDAMGACAAAGGAGGGSSELQAHTLTRHNNILLEFSREFARTRAAVTTNLERAQLLGVFGKAGGREGGGAGSSAGAEVLSETARLLNERTSIHSALSQADDVIKQAYATSSSLAQQRSLLGGTFSKVTLLGNRIPGAASSPFFLTVCLPSPMLPQPHHAQHLNHQLVLHHNHQLVLHHNHQLVLHHHKLIHMLFCFCLHPPSLHPSTPPPLSPLPVQLNTLLSAIRRKKSRDSLILAAVIAACTLFLLVYWLNK